MVQFKLRNNGFVHHVTRKENTFSFILQSSRFHYSFRESPNGAPAETILRIWASNAANPNYVGANIGSSEATFTEVKNKIVTVTIVRNVFSVSWG